MQTVKHGRPDLEDIEFLNLQAAKIKLSKEDQAKVPGLVELCWKFITVFSGIDMYWYQKEFGSRILESLISNDGDETTALISRQAGKTETLTNVTCGAMILLPRLAKTEKYGKMLERFKDGLLVGIFAPVKDQAGTLYDRVVRRFSTDHAKAILADPEINEIGKSRGDNFLLWRCGSSATMMSAHTRSNIESKTYHLIIIDEAQKADDEIISRSIAPMGAHTNATMVLIGTPIPVKGYFYNAIQRNKNSFLDGKKKQSHFEYDWHACAEQRPEYAVQVTKAMERFGKDSDYFRQAYGVEWLLDRGMFITNARMMRLSEPRMERVESYKKSPCLIGIDIAKDIDSTVITVVMPEWDRPNENGLVTHWVLNWLELQGEFEAQYAQVYNFLKPYWVHAIGVDANGMGAGWPERMSMMFPQAHVEPLTASQKAQDVRYNHLLALCQGHGHTGPLLRWPLGKETKKLMVTRRFFSQMINVEKEYTKQGYLIVHAPKNSTTIHDDYVSSLANACVMSRILEDSGSADVEIFDNFLRAGSGRHGR